MRVSRVLRQATPAIAAALLAAPAPAAHAGDRSDFAIRFAQHQPAAPTAMTMHIRYKAPGDPDAKPSPIRGVIIDLPEGTGFSAAAAPPCTAGDVELQAEGRAACPPASRIGAGSLTAITGITALDPFPTDVTLFRSPEGIIELVSRQGGDQTIAIERLTLRGTRLTASPEAVPGGPPDGQTSVRDIDWLIGKPGLLTTPAACPPGGEWIARGTFTFADGATDQAVSATPCARDPARPARRSSGRRSRGARRHAGRHRLSHRARAHGRQRHRAASRT
jgi:hypothetical protein